MPARIEVTFALEPISPLLAEGLEDLIVGHAEEVEPDEVHVVDWPLILMLERAGKYKAVTARRGSKLVGYASYWLQSPVDRKNELWAMNHTLYLEPAYRRGPVGVRLRHAAEQMMKDLGAIKVTQGDRKPFNSTASKPSATLGDQLLRDGYTLAEKVYVKTL